MSSNRDQMVELADVPGGISSRELQAVFGMSAKLVNTAMTVLTQRGRVYRAKRAGDRARWFKKVANRDAWLLEMQRGETIYTVVPKDQRASLKPKGPRLVDVHQHLPSRARKPGAKPLPLPGSEMERALPVAGVAIDPNWMQRTGEAVCSVETVRSKGISAGHDPRYQVGPDDAFPAVFSGRRYGEYSEAASPWAKAAARGAAS
jgi:hypothetical protein